jgi:hypothetical protein
MPQNKPFRFGPLALTNTYTTNILNPGTTTGGVAATSAPYDKLRILLRHIRITNKTALAATFRLYLGATGTAGAGTELAFDLSVAANDVKDLWFASPLVLDTTDFLVGGASAAATLTIQGSGEIGIA